VRGAIGSVAPESARLPGFALPFYHPGGLTPMLEQAAETPAHVLESITFMRFAGIQSERIVI
jgi:hypothetical protein